MEVFDIGFEPKMSPLLVVDWGDAVGRGYVGIVDQVHKRILNENI